MTGRDLLSASLRLLGVLASGESLSANEASDGLASFNRMLDSWSNESLMIPNKVREVFPLALGQQSYTMGVGGNFNTSRPMRIETAELQITSSSPLLELPIKILTKDEYAAILIKTLQSPLPTYLYSEGTYPLETINLWPVPSAASNLVLYSEKPLSNLATVGSTLSLPPGYERALVYNLAVELAPEYGKEPSALVVQTAIESRAVLKRMNAKPKYLQVDGALRARPAVFNWMTGEPT